MNVVDYCIQTIKRIIPLEILQKAFYDDEWRASMFPVSLDELIRQKVFVERIWVDCNLEGGLETTINLSGCPMEQFDAFNRVYTIPKSHTMGRSILRVRHISFGGGAVHAHLGMNPLTSNATLEAGKSLVQALTPIPQVSTAQVYLIGENTVALKHNIALPPEVWLDCVLEMDHAFNHLQSSAYVDFLKLFRLGVQAYIYWKLNFKVSRGELEGGYELSIFRNEIDKFSDSEELYQEELRTNWSQINLFNDPHAKMRHYKMLVRAND